MSQFSPLARGTGSENGVIIGEGLETILDHLSAPYQQYPGIEFEKPKTAPLPSTFVTRRGPLVLYSRPDLPPTWEENVLNCYDNMGSLVGDLESVSTRKEEKIKGMDPRCVPGRHFNGYVGVLKNSLFFPKKGLSPGLELLPMHLEDMGVSIAEFLRGKGCYDHLIPPEKMSDYLPIIKDLEEEAKPPEKMSGPSQEASFSQPTPAPPQSPLPDDNNQNRVRSIHLSAGTRRRGSGRRIGSARSMGRTSEADSAYGTKLSRKERQQVQLNKMYYTSKLPPINPSQRTSVDMSTHRSAISTPNRLDAVFDPHATAETKVAVPTNNSGDRTGFVERPQMWMPESSGRASHSNSANDEVDTQPEPRIRVGDSNKLMTRTRVAEWVNAADCSIPPPTTPNSNRGETDDENDAAHSELAIQSSESFSADNEKPQPLKIVRKSKMEGAKATDSSSLDQVTVTSSFGSGVMEMSNSRMKSIDEVSDERAPSQQSSMEGNETKAFSMTDLEEAPDAYEAESEPVPSDPCSGTPFSHHLSPELLSDKDGPASSGVTSTSLAKEQLRRNRNASNAFGVEWPVENESPVGKEFLSDAERFSSARQMPDSFAFSVDREADSSPPKPPRPQSSLSGTSGVETLRPSSAASAGDLPIAVQVKNETRTVRLVEPSSPAHLPPDAMLDGRSSHPVPSAPAPTPNPIGPGKRSKSPARQKTAPKTSRRAKGSRRAARPSSARPKSAEAAAAAEAARLEREEVERVRLQERKAAMEAKARADKERRLAAAALLQERIKTAEEQRQEQQRASERRRKETEKKLKALVAEEEAMRLMEEEARQQIAANRKEMREAREARRQEELEKRKEEIRRRREDDERRQDQATRREREMLSRLGDPALRQRMEDDDLERKAERERLMAEQLADEERFAADAAAAEEARMAEWERLAENEAVSRIREDMDEVEERRRKLLREQEALRQEEEELSLTNLAPTMTRSCRRQFAMRRVQARLEIARPSQNCLQVARALALFSRLAQSAISCQKWPPPDFFLPSEPKRPAARRLKTLRLAALAEKKKEEEEKEREMERQRLREEEERAMQLKLDLEEADLQQRLREEAEQREEEARRRQKHNLEFRSHLQGLQLEQSLTRPWVFSYFVHWPRESFEKPIGGGASKQKRFRFPPPKSAGKDKGSLPPL